jgi:hypothetical protein
MLGVGTCESITRIIRMQKVAWCQPPVQLERAYFFAWGAPPPRD